MSFSNMLEILQERNRKKIVLIKQGRTTRLTNENLNCLRCKGISAYKEDEYLLALSNFFEKLENNEKDK